jgi:hypothetical protein
VSSVYSLLRGKTLRKSSLDATTGVVKSIIDLVIRMGLSVGGVLWTGRFDVAGLDGLGWFYWSLGNIVQY